MKNTIVIVSCYGLIHESRTQIELDGLDKYIRSFCEYITNLDHKPAAIVLCGGRTSPEISAESEAESVMRYIFDNELLSEQHLLIETTSHNTPEQLVFGMLHIRKLLKSDTTVLCICDTPRFEKVSLEASILFGDYFDIEVQAFDRRDVHPNSNKEFQLFTALPEDLKSEGFESLKKYLHETLLSLQFEEGFDQDEEAEEVE